MENCLLAESFGRVMGVFCWNLWSINTSGKHVSRLLKLLSEKMPLITLGKFSAVSYYYTARTRPIVVCLFPFGEKKISVQRIHTNPFALVEKLQVTNAPSIDDWQNYERQTTKRPFQHPTRHLLEVSKPWDLHLKLSDHFEIWQASCHH